MERQARQGWDQPGAVKKRLYNADDIAHGVQVTAKIREQMIPLEHAQRMQALTSPPVGAAPQPEMLEGHCVNCKTRRPFTVEGEETMKNGAVRKYGKGTHPDCGHRMSKFVSGVKEAAA